MASQKPGVPEGFIREKMWVTRPAGTHLSESQKKPGEYSPLTRDDETNELGQVTLDPIDEGEADSWSSLPPVWDYGTTASTSAERPEADEELHEAIAVLVGAVIGGTVVAAPYVKKWWEDNALTAMRTTMTSTRESARNMKTTIASTVESAQSTTSAMASALAATMGSARSKIVRALKSDRQADAGEMVTFAEAPADGPSTELAALPAEGGARISSAEAQQRMAAAVMARAISEKARAFSDEQMRTLLGAMIDDAGDLPAVSSAIKRLTPEEIEVSVNRMLEANPAFLQELVKTFWAEQALDGEALSRSLDPRAHRPSELGAG
jgi:hypothetical protein